MSDYFDYTNQQQVNSNLDLKLVNSSQESLAASESDREDVSEQMKRYRDRIRALESENLYLRRLVYDSSESSVTQAQTIMGLHDQLDSLKKEKLIVDKKYNEIMCTFASHKLQTDEDRRQSNDNLERLSTKVAQLEEENRRLKDIQQQDNPTFVLVKQHLPSISIQTSEAKSKAPGIRRRNNATPFSWDSLLKGTTVLTFFTLMVVVFVGYVWLAHISSK